ncbi:hypothetical protein RB195_000990 [Necator americanus]|uniref:Uncharacterized protein n=1 Tax=Necator americanus TaxID=51031 RepID=A0ABR1DC89_NECAM
MWISLRPRAGIGVDEQPIELVDEFCYRNSPIMIYGSETFAEPSTMMERLDCTERKLLRLLLGYFWPRVCYNEDLYAEIDVVYRWVTRGKHQHLAPKVAKVNRLRFFGHILRRPADRLVKRVLRSSVGSSWKKHLADNGSSGLRW